MNTIGVKERESPGHAWVLHVRKEVFSHMNPKWEPKAFSRGIDVLFIC